MYIQSISQSNPFLRLLDSYWTADNPNKNSASIPVDGAALSSVSDLDKRGNTVTQVTGSKQPIYKTNIINGHNVFRFDGVDDTLSRTNSVNNNFTGAMTLIAVCKTTTTVGQGRILSNCGVSAGGFTFGRAVDKFIFSARGVTDYGGTITTWVANTWQVFTVTYNGSNSVTFYKNGVLSETLSGGAVLSSPFDLVMGTFDGTGTPWAGDMLMVGWAWRLLNSGEMTLLNNSAKSLIGL